MKLQCPKCRRPIPSENANVQTDLAQCRECGEVHRLSELFDADIDRTTLDSPPPGAWYRDGVTEQVVGATTRHPIAFFLVPFMCVWSGGSLGGIYGSQIATGKFNPLISLFGIPFLLGSVIFWSLALMAIWGKVEISVRDGQGTIFTGLGRLGWRRKFHLDDVHSITEESGKANYPGSMGSKIVLKGKTVVSFGSNLREQRRYFLLNVLKQLKSRRLQGPTAR